ncbi:hypothetical protein N9B34_02765 [Akkermansiaceae bacterium]|nr:hypothetical protein [Akkermansiaceae bacterium]
MIASSAIDYFVAQGLGRSSDLKRRRLLLGISLVSNLGLLFVFKYLVFAADNIWKGLGWLGIDVAPVELNILLPLGISFYTFQTISYTIDVYRGFIKPEKDFILYSCFVMYFPQLVAGPILRASEIIFQLAERPKWSFGDLVFGLKRILFGLFLKVVLADNIAPLVDSGFSFPASALGALDVWTLSFLFGFQIYFDFSAYSHIAIGTARLMGIHFPENFNYPFLSTSPREFWRRWHISLSSWIRDYLYLPLAGAKVRGYSTGGLAEAVPQEKVRLRYTRALFLTWAIMGLWHGAAWTFVFWGLWHALLIWAYRVSGPIREKLPNISRVIVGWPVTLCLAMLSWIPFRAEGLGDAFAMLGRLIKLDAYFQLGLRENTYLVAAIVFLGCISAWAANTYVEPWLKGRPLVWIIAHSVIFTVVISLVFVFLRPIQQFIYFQF